MKPFKIYRQHDQMDSGRLSADGVEYHDC